MCESHHWKWPKDLEILPERMHLTQWYVYHSVIHLHGKSQKYNLLLMWILWCHWIPTGTYITWRTSILSQTHPRGLFGSFGYRFGIWLSTSTYYYIYYHYSDVIMGAIASQITSLTIVYLTVYLGADQWKHQSSASLAFVRGIHRWPVNSPHIWPVTRKMFPFDDIIMIFSLLR